VHRGGLEGGGVDEGFDRDGLLSVVCGDILEDLRGCEGFAVLNSMLSKDATKVCRNAPRHIQSARLGVSGSTCHT